MHDVPKATDAGLSGPSVSFRISIKELARAFSTAMLQEAQAA